MDDFFITALKNFSFTEIICFYLLWRIENKLDAFTVAINKAIDKFDQDILRIEQSVARHHSNITPHT